MAIISCRVGRCSVLVNWIVCLLFLRIEVKCCEFQPLLCSYPQGGPGDCIPVCRCAIYSHTNSRQIICDGVLSNIPLGQLYKDLDFVSITNNNIRIIKNETFRGLSVGRLSLNKNNIKAIEASAFAMMDIALLDLSGNLLTVIGQWTFNNIQSLTTLNLNRNLIKVIGSQAFMNLPKLKTVLLQFNQIETIQSEAFLNIFDLSSIVMDPAPSLQAQTIERNAFYNITGDNLVFSDGNDLFLKENFIYSHFNKIYFPQSINCNCTMMWIALWLQDETHRNNIHDGATCNNQNNTLVSNLTLDVFSNCRDMPVRHECRETKAVNINCSLSFVSGNFIEWIHSRNGKHIRTLKTLTNILSIPFCSLDDIGEYTCVRSTLHPAAPYINTTTTLHVRGKPVILNRQTHTNGADLVLSLTIFTSDDVDIQWILNGINLTSDADYMIDTSVIPIKITQYNTPVEVNGLITNLIIRNYNSLSTRAYTCRISNDIETVKEVLLSRPIDIIFQPNTFCETSSKLEIDCTFIADGAIPKYFKHTVGGKLIRKLPGSRVNNTYTLVIPFCNSQDQGDYTCYWETNVSGFEMVSKTTTLTVNGPPIILYHTETLVDGFIILSVMLFSNPYPNEPQWYLDDVKIMPSFEIQQTTSISLVEMKLHRVTANVNGFISNLTIKEGHTWFGNYKCVVKNSYGTSEKTITRFDGTFRSSDLDNDSQPDRLPVILGSVAAAVTILFIILLVVSITRRKQRTDGSRTYDDSNDRPRNEEDPYDKISSSATKMEQDYIDIIE